MLCSQHRAWRVSVELLWTLGHLLLLGKSLPLESIPSPRSNLCFHLSCWLSDTPEKMSISALCQIPGTRIIQNISGPEMKVCQLHPLHSSRNWSCSRRLHSHQIQAFPLLFLFYFLMGKKHFGLVGLGCQGLTDTLSRLQETSQPLLWTFAEGTATENVIHFDDSFLMRARTGWRVGQFTMAQKTQ